MHVLVTRFVLAGTKEEVSAARRTVVDTVQTWGVHPGEVTTDVIRLVVSELVTNAVIHGEGPVTVELRHRSGSLVIGVLDSNPGAPESRWPDSGAESGRGLGLVGFLAMRSGWEPIGHGKRVWAEIALREPAPSDITNLPDHGLPAGTPAGRTEKEGARGGAQHDDNTAGPEWPPGGSGGIDRRPRPVRQPAVRQPGEFWRLTLAGR